MINRTGKPHSFNYGKNIIPSKFFCCVICAVIAILYSVGIGSAEEINDTKFSTNLNNSQEEGISAETVLNATPENKLVEIMKLSKEGKHRSRHVQVRLI